MRTKGAGALAPAARGDSATPTPSSMASARLRSRTPRLCHGRGAPRASGDDRAGTHYHRERAARGGSGRVASRGDVGPRSGAAGRAQRAPRARGRVHGVAVPLVSTGLDVTRLVHDPGGMLMTVSFQGGG